MDVGTLGADYLAKDAVLRHVEGTEFKPVVAAVFKNHAVLLLLLGQVDECPALLKVHGRGHFDSRVLAVFEGALGYGEVVIPVGGYIYEVDVGTAAEFLIAFCTRVDVGRGKANLLEVALATFGAGCFVVAEGHDLHTGNVSETGYCTGATHAKTHESHAQVLLLGADEVEHVLLACGALRSVHNDGSFVPMPLGGRRQRLCAHRETAHREQGRKGHGKCSNKFLHLIQVLDNEYVNVLRVVARDQPPRRTGFTICHAKVTKLLYTGNVALVFYLHTCTFGSSPRLFPCNSGKTGHGAGCV